MDGRPVRAYEKEYRDQLLNNRKASINLIIELIRYQNWLEN